MEMKDEINRRRKENWFDVWFSIEALAVDESTVKSALEKHAEKLSHVRDVFVYEKQFKEIKKVETPLKGIDSAYSYVVSIKFLAKTLSTLLNTVLTYGPSAIEILGPHKKDVDVGEVQEISNVLAGLVHQFAAAGVGGIVITPEEKKK